MDEQPVDQDDLDDAFRRLVGQVHHQFRKRDTRKRDRPRRGEQAVARKKKQTDEDNISPVIKFARMLGDYKTTAEVAEELGVSESLIRKWRAKGVADAPSYVTDFGEHTMALYTEQDIANLRSHQRAKQRVRPNRSKK